MEFLSSDAADAHLHTTVFPLLKRCGVAGAAITFTKSAGQRPFSLVRAYGYSSLQARTPVDEGQTWFDCGACARLVTVLTVLHLCEKFNVPLSTDVNKLLPKQIRVETITSPVTLHHLLTHTSGAVHNAGADEEQTPMSTELGVANVRRYLSRGRIACNISPGIVYRSDIMLLAAVAEHLGGGPSYPQLAHDLILTPLGITLGRSASVVSYSSDAATDGPGPGVGHGAGNSAAAAGWLGPDGPEGVSLELTPLSGLVLTAQGAAKLLSVLLLSSPAADAAPPPASSPASASTPSQQQQQQQQQQQASSSSILSPAMVHQMLQAHLVDSDRQLPIGFLLTCPSIGNVNSCFCITHAAGREDGPADENVAAGTDRARSRRHPGCERDEGPPRACQALFAVLPASGVGLCVLCNTAEPPGAAGGGPGSFCHQVASSLFQRFRPLQEPGAVVRPWLVNVPPVRPDVLVHLICCPPAAALTNSAFDRWSAGLPDYVRVRAVQMPGHAARAGEEPLLRVAKIAIAVADAIAALTPSDTPIVLFGHGLGGLVAFEAARRLEGWHCRRPLHLLVSGCASPDTWPSNQHPGRRYTPWALASSDMARHLGLPPTLTTHGQRGVGSGGSEAVDISYAHDLSDEKLATLLAACPRTPPALRSRDAAAALSAERLAVVRGDVEAEEMYAYRAPPPRGAGAAEAVLATLRSRSENEELASSCLLSCPITLLRGDADTTLHAASEQQQSPQPGDALPSLLKGWASMTSGPVQAVALPGDHFYHEEDKGRAAVLARLTQLLGRRLTAHTPWLASKPPGGGRPAASAAARRA